MERVTNAKKIQLLQKILDQSSDIVVRSSSDAKFKAWKNNVECSLIRVFGQNSPELKHFQNLRFYYRPVLMTLGEDYSQEHRQCFDRDFEIFTSSLRTYIEELRQEADEIPDLVSTIVSANGNGIKRVFISHSKKDSEFVEEIIEILEMIGLDSQTIFCSSFAGYDIELGANFLDTLRDELNSDTLVLFVLTHNFYSNPICLCEMGATWVQTKEHIPILIPPFDFSDIKGVIPLTQGFKLNEPLKLNLFREKIESLFSKDSMNQTAWERKRDRIVKRINEKIAAL